ncbi:MAG TPA: glutaredoxin domain-containing protein [Acidimicrobiia bacterium]|nr:glutaredoxin domain-containing protein [Acidimicrobiia bacterium]
METSGGVVLAAIAVASAIAFAYGATYMIRRRARRATLDLSAIGGRVVFFSDTACRKCPAARDALVSAGAEFEEIRYGDDPARFRATGVPAVPLVVVRDEAGVEVGRIAGEVRARELRALLRRAGL